MYSACKLNKQGDNIKPWHTPFPIWNQSVVPCPVLTVASWPAYRFLKRQVRWSGIPISFRIFQFIVVHTVKGFGIVNKAEVRWDEVRWGEIAQLYPTLCDPVDSSLPGSFVHGILQARILEWVAISFSRGSSPPRDQTQVSCIGGRRFNLWATRECSIKQKQMFFWNSLAFSMIQLMLAIWSLVPLPFLKPVEHLEVHSSRIAEAWLGEFWALLY